MENPVIFFEIAGKRIEKLSAFYASVFGWKMTPAPDGVLEIDTGTDTDIQGILYPVEDNSDYSNHVIIYVRVDDLDTSIKRLEHLGGKVFMTPEALPNNMGSFAIFTDPSGNFIGLHQNP